MVHSNPTDQERPHSQCAHGKCLDHGPEWENIGEKWLSPLSWIFAWTLGRWWFNWCCGKPMARMYEVQKRRCKKCGRKEDHVISSYVALCQCCGKRFTHSSAYD